MKLNYHLILILVSSAHKSQEKTWSQNDNSSDTSEKKIYFTGNSQQFVKFDVNIPQLIDFAMCVWYKPVVMLEQNVLFAYNAKNQPLVLWKIKKNQKQPTIVLKIKDVVVMELMIENLKTGKWHHICQYWKGSTGLWALFLNNYILSYGYKAQEIRSDWLINTANGTATIDHTKMKNTLHGVIYGFYMMSLSGEINFVSEFPNHKHKTIGTKRHKRQAQSSTIPPPLLPTDLPKPKPAFPRIRNFFRLIRRLIEMVTLPFIRFSQGLVQPWTRKLVMPVRPTQIPSTTPIVTLVVTEPTTANKLLTLKTEIPQIDSSLPSINSKDSILLEEQIMVYESKLETEERRHLRNIQNTARAVPNITDVKSLVDSSKIFSQSPKFGEDISVPLESNKCLQIEETFKNLKILQPGDFEESNIDNAIIHLGNYLRITQILYNCCNEFIFNDNLLISWSSTKLTLKNVLIDSVAECGNF